MENRVEEFRSLDSDRRAAITESEQLKAQKNAESVEIAKLRKQGLDAEDRQQKVRSMGERITALDNRVKDLDESFRTMLAGIPNIPHESVPAKTTEIPAIPAPTRGTRAGGRH